MLNQIEFEKHVLNRIEKKLRKILNIEVVMGVEDKHKPLDMFLNYCKISYIEDYSWDIFYSGLFEHQYVPNHAPKTVLVTLRKNVR